MCSNINTLDNLLRRLRDCTRQQFLPLHTLCQSGRSAEYDSEMSRATSIPVRLGDSDGIQSHPLISSAVAVGDATAILPVVSTLVFGFAFENLLVGAGRFHRVSEIFLGLSASLSLYTTAFSVLEFYYVKMLTSADIYRQFMDKCQGSDPEVGVKPDGETLAQHTDDLILRFSRMRLLARNALWSSIVFLLCASCSEILTKSDVGVWAFILCCILLAGVVAVPFTVAEFRGAYRPVLAAYREDHGLPSGLAAASQRRHTGRFARAALPARENAPDVP